MHNFLQKFYLSNELLLAPLSTVNLVIFLFFMFVMECLSINSWQKKNIFISLSKLITVKLSNLNLICYHAFILLLTMSAHADIKLFICVIILTFFFTYFVTKLHSHTNKCNTDFSQILIKVWVTFLILST